MAKQVTKSGDSVIVYDDTLVSQISASFFEPDYWGSADRTAGKAGGRGAAIYISHAGQDWVLRHYYRGGIPGKLLTDQFLWAGRARTRSMREWDLLQNICNLGLPAPQPVAARYVRHGLLYTADLITRMLPGVIPFSKSLAAAPAPPSLWEKVGDCIARFHAAGFCHADLNAHNLQVDESNEVFLLDWDRGAWRPPGSWAQGNLDRLHRSLQKIARAPEGAYWDESDWEMLLAAYARRRETQGE